MINGQLVLLLIAFVLALVGLVQSNWRSATAGAVVVLLLVLLLPYVGLR